MVARINILIVLSGILAGNIHAQNVDIFNPAKIPDTIAAHRINGYINVDGIMNEGFWGEVQYIESFKEVEPNQGMLPSLKTKVKILYNNRFLYFGIFCKDSLGKKGLRIQNLTRDFDFDENDVFGIGLDPFKTKRNSLSFQTNPYAAQRDLQTFDDLIYDTDWDALWKVRTSRSDSGWTAEFEIPFKTLRYADSSDTWRINFVRNARRLYQISAYPGYPRAYSTYRMPYTAILSNLQVPPRSNNIRINPYSLVENNRKSFTNNTKDTSVESSKVRAGADLKWALSSHAVLDLTYNMDFAQADADQQVINLNRFSVFFPEKRQFFLENSGLFKAGQDELIQPFFSRRIGLDDYGNRIPVNGGARFTSRTVKTSIGALFLKQKSTDILPASYFSVFRYQRNYGEQNNVGVLITNRIDEKINSGRQKNNTTASINGFNRFNQKWSLEYLVSGSSDEKKDLAGYVRITHITDIMYFSSLHGVIGNNYVPGMGFIATNNLIFHSTGGYATLRPKWRPKYVRRMDPGFNLNLYQYADNFNFREASLDIYPVWVWFNNRSRITYTFQPNWQNLIEDFYPVNIKIAAGKYQFNRHIFSYRSDQSRKLSSIVSYGVGKYYNGSLTNIIVAGRYAPIPHISTEVRYEYNNFRNLGELSVNENASLYSINSRLALNPRVQANIFYQYNGTSKTDRLNFRISWEYQPLSYFYLVYNRIDNKDIKSLDQQSIAKITFLRQF